MARVPITDVVLAPPEAPRPAGPSRRAQEDARLFERYRRTGDQHARDALVERFMPMARQLAARYRDGHEYDDLVQVASFALIKAIGRYDPDRGLAFSSYAVPTILGELKRYFRDYTWAVRVPRDLQDRALRVRRVSAQLTTRLGRSPTPAEIAEALDSSVELVLEALQTATAYTPDRLDAPADRDDDDSAPSGPASVETGYELADAAATLAPLLARLTPREQHILCLRFDHDLTQSEIGTRLGISQMHVSRIVRKAIAELQTLAAER